MSDSAKKITFTLCAGDLQELCGKTKCDLCEKYDCKKHIKCTDCEEYYCNCKPCGHCEECSTDFVSCECELCLASDGEDIDPCGVCDMCEDCTI